MSRGMIDSSGGRDLVWIQTPFGEPAARAVVAAARAGGFGVLDLGGDAAKARRALDAVVRRTNAPFGVRVSSACPLEPGDLPGTVSTVVIADHALAARWRGAAGNGSDQGREGDEERAGGHGRTRPVGGDAIRRVVAEVCSRDEARGALAAEVDGLVAKGAESGGRVGTTGAFLLCQQVLDLTDVPVWVKGGMGRHTASAAVIGGAAGVVLDAQVALLEEVALPRAVRAAIAAMDGSETRVVAGHRVYSRPDLWVAGVDDRTAPEELVPRLGAASLTEDALPVGQDGAVASQFAKRYGTVGRLVSELRREVSEHVGAARRVEPLAPGNGLSAVAGTRYPVVQGPMTRVSDRPALARAVADNGGLPFLALALLKGPEVRPLLEETAARLGDAPWGVGVLGFVPKELREEQLEVIHDVRPPFALIAGGRPGQALALEEAGIRTFLHVPAPGLLERFLRDGARRFVFEGFECGGHVGPRSSFALWESQLEVLEAWGASGGSLDELDILFAGGIHDERSAAMVATLAGPLAAGGARIGVLVGTAYLFTEEAVASGAIGEEFQVQALACERTALLESSPGHVTRCAETPFVDLFERTRRDLIEAGADGQARWAELEGLNLGRLRVASKGLKRDGAELVSVDRACQRDEGMFMIGDVATLRSELSSIADLHASVATGASEYLAATGIVEQQAGEARWPAGGPERPEPGPVDVAIVGMACVMPDALDVEAFWANIVAGRNSVTEVSPERWDPAVYFDPEWDHQSSHVRQGSASKWGGFLPDVPFDPFAYGIPPASMAAIEPTQLLSLKVAADALADAGYADRPFARERTSVIFGAEGGTDQSATQAFRAMFPAYAGEMPREMEEWLPKVTEDTFPGLLTNVISGRIANRLDLGGKNITVDAACASSLAAVDAACSELASGGSDLVLAGGSDLHNGVQDFLLFTNTHALSTQGQCRTFDASADGITLGEGIACVVLKRLADAEADGDRIYAVIKGVAASSDGRSLGLTAPRQEGQERALRRTYARSGVNPRDVQLVEAHGTGTTVGDRTELATLTGVFTEAGMGTGECVVGSVKSNIGHTKCAAGLAGLIKATKAVYHGVKPPTLHIEQPNPGWGPDTSPFVFLDRPRPWLEERRVAALSAFGFGGTNFHAVIESYDDAPARGLDEWPAELFVLRGDRAGVDRVLADLAGRLEEPAVRRNLGGHRLRDVAAAVADQSRRGPVRVAIVADDLEDLRTKVSYAREGRAAPGVYLADGTGTDAAVTDGKVAFLFPGQGSQYPNMAADLFVAFDEARELLELGLGHRWADVMLPSSGFTDEGRRAQAEALTDTRLAQPALGLADLATSRMLVRFGLRPDLMAGHSYGELVALCVAGAYDEETLLALSEARAEAILGAAGDDPGAMLAVSASREQLQAVLDGSGDVVVANDNHPAQVVLAGPTPAIGRVRDQLENQGITAKRLPVACAFHSPVVAGASPVLDSHLANAGIRAPQLPVFSNLTAQPYPDDPTEVRELLGAQVANGVRFTEQIRAMYDAGARVFVEAGPGRTLTGCVQRILDGRPHLAVAADRPGDSGIRSVLHALAQLAVAGVPVDILELFEHRSVRPERWLHPDRPAGWTINGHLIRDADGHPVPGGLKPATTAPRIQLGSAPSPGATSSPGTAGAGSPVAAGSSLPPGQALTEYLRTAHQVLEAGHQLLMTYLGIDPAQVSAPAAASPSLPSPPAPLQPHLPNGASGNGIAPEAMPAPTAAPSAAGDLAAPPVGMASGAGASSVPAAGSVAEMLGEPDELLGRLTAIVSSRTGYPEEMLAPDLDVEADLSIDSIKRLEILGELADQTGLSDRGSALDQLESLVEQLAARKTLQGIVDFLFEHAPMLGDAGSPGSDGVPPAAAPSPSPSPSPNGVPPAANRFVVGLQEVPLGAPEVISSPVRVTGEGPLAEALATELATRGADVARASIAGGEVAGAADDGLVVVTDLFDGFDVPDLYRSIRPLLLETGCDLVVVSPLGGGLGIDPPAPCRPSAQGASGLHQRGSMAADGDLLPRGAGVRGLVKTAALEFPDRRIRLVDLDPAAGSAESARLLAEEAHRVQAPVEVGWRAGRRRAPVALSQSPQNGHMSLPLTGESVVLLTGGARGITARVAVALAHRSGCHLHLVGRSPFPQGDEDPALAEHPDRTALRGALARAGERDPKAIEQACDRILAEREIRRNEAEMTAAGSSVTYHQVDVRDAEALAAVVESIYRTHGRLDGIVHGAGVLDDHLIAGKHPDAFERVYATKVDSARTLLGAVRAAIGEGRERPRFIAFFGSIAGVCGNRGQADYAAANDALDTLAGANPDLAGAVLAVDWGPWSPEAGMVSDSLAKAFEEAGMGLIQPEDGTAVVLGELTAAAAGNGATGGNGTAPQPAHQVVAVRCSPEVMALSLSHGQGHEPQGDLPDRGGR